MRRIRIDARCGIAHQAGEIVRAHRVAGLDDQVGIGAQAHGDQVVVHGSQRQQAGDGHFAFRRAVGQHDQVHAIAHRLLDVDAQLVERHLERALGGIAVISAREALRLEADAIDGAQAIELVVREHGAFQAHQAARVAAVLEHVAVVAHVQHAAGDEAFAQRINRRVRDLGEQLVEVIEEAALALRQARQRGVGAHGRQRHLALLGHGAHQLLHVVVMVAQLRQTARETHVRITLSGQLAGRRGLQIVDRQRLLVQPIAVRLLVGVTVADLVVPDDATLARVHLEHLAGAQATGLQHVCRVDVDGAHLRRQDQPVVAGDVVARRAQAVSVERGAEHAAVGERDGRRAVPRLHEHGLICVVGAALVGDAVVMVPRLGDHHGDGTVERAAVHGEELQHVVQNGRVRTLTVDNRQHLSQVIAQRRAVQLRLASACPADVAAQRVDLAVVDDVAVRMRALPAGRGVRGIARMHERQAGLHRRVVEVGEEAAHLRGHQHALVHDGARRHGAHVEDLARKRRVGVGGALDGSAAHVQLALERLTCVNVGRATQERLQDGGHARLRGGAEVVRVDGHLAPEHQRDAALRAALLERALRIAHARGVVVREEEHGHAVIALVGQKLTLLLGFLAEEAVRDLEQHAGAIAGVALQAGAAAMLKVHEHGKRIVEHGMAALALQVGQRADAARVVFVAGSVQAGRAHCGCRGCGMRAIGRFVRALRAGETSGRPGFAGCLGLFGKFSVHMRSFVWMKRPPENVSGPHSVCRPRVTRLFPPLCLTSWKQHRSNVET